LLIEKFAFLLFGHAAKRAGDRRALKPNHFEQCSVVVGHDTRAAIR
jgi:hypothetical protein